MKSCITVQAILVFLTLFASTYASGQWGINGICGPTGSNFLINEFGLLHNSAVSMQNNLNAPNDATNTLVGYMFGTEQTNYDPISFPRTVFGGGEGIAGLANIAGPVSQDSLGENDTMVFCNMQHLFPPNGPSTRWYDSAFRIMRGDSLGHVRACYYGQPYPNGMNPPNAILMRIARAGQPQALIFCEWFMERAMSAQFPNGRNFNSNFFARAEAYKARYGLPPATAQIDIFYLFDSTFMHELTHSISGGSKVDVDWPFSYRWVSTRRLSTNANPQTGAPNNVDNYIMLKLANDITGLGWTVNVDGSMTET